MRLGCFLFSALHPFKAQIYVPGVQTQQKVFIVTTSLKVKVIWCFLLSFKPFIDSNLCLLVVYSPPGWTYPFVSLHNESSFISTLLLSYNLNREPYLMESLVSLIMWFCFILAQLIVVILTFLQELCFKLTDKPLLLFFLHPPEVCSSIYTSHG